MSFFGRWEIESTEMWGRDYIDLLERGHFLIAADGTGSFVFGNMCGGIDGYTSKAGSIFEFTWDAVCDDGDRCSGRGRFELDPSGLVATGIFAIHLGDISAIQVVRC